MVLSLYIQYHKYLLKFTNITALNRYLLLKFFKCFNWLLEVVYDLSILLNIIS